MGSAPATTASVELPSVPERRGPRRAARTAAGPRRRAAREGGAAPGRPGPRDGALQRRARAAPTPTAPATRRGRRGPSRQRHSVARPRPAGPLRPGRGRRRRPATPPPTPPPPPAPPPPTLGDTTREVTDVVGTEVGRVSPEAGEVIVETGDTAGDVVDASCRRASSRRPERVSR